MASITHRGERYEGKTPGSIARRVWGRNAIVRPTNDPNCRWDGAYQGMITRTDRHGTHILANNVVIREES
jgi:hypothetical protein